VDTLTQRLLAGGLDRGQAVAQDGGEDIDELAVAIGGTDELAADPLQPGGQHPVLEWRAVAQGSRLGAHPDAGARGLGLLRHHRPHRLPVLHERVAP
jgi:hypothetical protein